VLESILANLAGLQGIVACSYFMLPAQPARRARLYEILFRAEAEFHFAMEDVAIARPADIDAVEEILTIHRTLQRCPTTIPGIEAPA
jgi:sporadic carbohydrate cluster protein (TIGR04323 family)